MVVGEQGEKERRGKMDEEVGGWVGGWVGGLYLDVGVDNQLHQPQNLPSEVEGVSESAFLPLFGRQRFGGLEVEVVVQMEVCRVGGWVGGWVVVWVGGGERGGSNEVLGVGSRWVGGKVEQTKAVGMRCWMLGGRWVGGGGGDSGWVGGREEENLQLRFLRWMRRLSML